MDFEQSQHDASARRKQIQKGLIHVVVDLDPERDGAVEETLLAYPIGGNYAQIASIPFFASDIGLDDIVETEITAAETRNFVRVMKKNTNVYYLQFQATEAEVEKANVLSEYLLKRGLRSESFAPGVFAIAVPVYFDRAVVEEIVSISPYPLTIEED